MIKREISKRKSWDNYFSWMGNKELRELMRDFALKEGNCKYYYNPIRKINYSIIFKYLGLTLYKFV